MIPPFPMVRHLRRPAAVRVPVLVGVGVRLDSWAAAHAEHAPPHVRRRGRHRDTPRRRPVFAREPVRARLYALIAPSAAVLVGYGWASEAQAALWVGLATAVLGPVAVESARARVTPVPREPDDRGAGEVKAVLLTALGVALGLVLAGLAFWAFQAHNVSVGLA